MSIGGDDLLTMIEQEHPRLGQYLRRYMVPAVENLGTNLGASPTGFVPTPTPPENVIVNQQGDEHVQLTIQHSAPVNKGIQYFSELTTSDSFISPRIFHHGVSRSPEPIFLPTNDSMGTPHSYRLRVYAQEPGSLPSAPYEYPVPIVMSGATNADHTPGTGSGSSPVSGVNGGHGLGTVLQRPGPMPKRSMGVV